MKRLAYQIIGVGDQVQQQNAICWSMVITYRPVSDGRHHKKEADKNAELLRQTMEPFQDCKHKSYTSGSKEEIQMILLDQQLKREFSFQDGLFPTILFIFILAYGDGLATDEMLDSLASIESLKDCLKVVILKDCKLGFKIKPQRTFNSEKYNFLILYSPFNTTKTPENDNFLVQSFCKYLHALKSEIDIVEFLQKVAFHDINEDTPVEAIPELLIYPHIRTILHTSSHRFSITDNEVNLTLADQPSKGEAFLFSDLKTCWEEKITDVMIRAGYNTKEHNLQNAVQVLKQDFKDSSLVVFFLARLLQHKGVTSASLVQGEEPIPIANLVNICRGFKNKPTIIFFLDVAKEPNPRCSTSANQDNAQLCTSESEKSKHIVTVLHYEEMFQKLLTLLSKPRSENRTENLFVALSNLIRNCRRVKPYPEIWSNFHQRIDSLFIGTSSDITKQMQSVRNSGPMTSKGPISSIVGQPAAHRNRIAADFSGAHSISHFQAVPPEDGSMEIDEVDSDVTRIPLAEAVQSNKIEDVRKLLLQGVDIDALLSGGRTALLVAADRCLEDICKMLLLANANPSSIDPRGYTALHFAVESSHSSPSSQFISVLCMMVPVNAMTNEGKTALHLAVGKDRYDVAKLLITKGATTTLLDNLGRSVLHVAAENGNVTIFQLLDEPHLKKMASTASLDTVMMPLHIAAKKGHAEFVRFILGKNLYTAQAKDKEGRSALHLATAERNWDVVNILLDHNWDIEDSMSVTNRKCLHLVSANGTIEGVQLFLRRGANADATDNQLWTPLHYAVSGNHLDVVTVLIEANADVNAKNLHDMTPVMLAQRDSSSKEIASIFSNGIADQEEAAGPAMMDIVDTSEANVDWGDLQARQRKQYLVHKHLENLKLNLALHRFITYPADYEAKAGLNRMDLAHSGFFFTKDYQSLQCFYCTYEIKTLEGWKGLDLDGFNHKHAEESRKSFGATCPLMKEEDLGDMPIVNPNNYMFEAHRLYSLLVGTWKNKNISIYDLAKNGFYFTGQDDNCRCVFCKLEVRGWEQGDTAESEHRRWNPRCAFLQPNNQTGNKAIGEEQTDEVGHDHISNPFVRTNIAQFGSHIRYCSMKKNWVPVESLGVTLVGDVKYPQFSTLQTRKNSYKNWPQQLAQKPDILIKAGFFYTGMGDRVLCFQCGGGLKDWDPADSPWVEHAKWFGSCPYLAIKKGKDYINHVVLSNKEPSEVTIATDGARVEVGSMKCRLCHSRDINCVNLPCGHMSTCVSCLPNENKCGVCGKVKSAFIEVFL